MDTLPSELLKYVCHCLDQSSLRTFSEVSSSCRAAAIDTLFRQVSLRFSSSQALLADVERLTGILQRLDAVGCVGKISVLSSDLHPLEGPHLPDCGDFILQPWKYCGARWPEKDAVEVKDWSTSHSF